MANKVFSFWDELVEKLSPQSPVWHSRGKKERGFANRQEFIDKIVEHFKAEFRKKSTRRDILYPTSFLIYLNPNDYNRQKQDFQFTVKNAVEEFYGYINSRIKSDNYTPHANYWLFQFCSFTGSSIENKGEEITDVPQGEVYIISDTFPVDFSKTNVGVGNVKGTLHAKDSAKAMAINPALFRVIEQLGKDKWKIDWKDDDRRNAKVSTDPVSYEDKNRNIEGEAYAVLTCDEKFIGRDGAKGKEYYMVDRLIDLSGKDDTRTGSQIAKIDSSNVLISHVQIKYIPETQRFQLAAFGEIRLNERNVELSSGGNIVWKDLSNNSNILINNEIGIKFKIK
ncbi:MAG: hypothetical protein LBR34_08900 [Prevotella sp.]|jgi:hypothetical protein|nr:hypothetical protein [Prevotella sp.]